MRGDGVPVAAPPPADPPAGVPGGGTGGGAAVVPQAPEPPMLAGRAPPAAAPLVVLLLLLLLLPVAAGTDGAPAPAPAAPVPAGAEGGGVAGMPAPVGPWVLTAVLSPLTDDDPGGAAAMKLLVVVPSVPPVPPAPPPLLPAEAEGLLAEGAGVAAVSGVVSVPRVLLLLLLLVLGLAGLQGWVLPVAAHEVPLTPGAVAALASGSSSGPLHCSTSTRAAASRNRYLRRSACGADLRRDLCCRAGPVRAGFASPGQQRRADPPGNLRTPIRVSCAYCWRVEAALQHGRQQANACRGIGAHCQQNQSQVLGSDIICYEDH